ncbi:MAG: Rossmann-like domain-containing protein [Candidatus Hodarchaeales archaeon]|jgi:uncharacterized protein (DUF4213/DUF364 family)
MNSFLSPKSVSGLNIESVIIGIRYTCVLLSSGSCGVAYTLNNQKDEKERNKKYLADKYLHDKDLEFLVKYCASKYSIFRSVGVAALNAFSQTNLPSKEMRYHNLSSLFPESSETIGMIGNIQPVSRSLIQKGHQVKILDRFVPPLLHPQITVVEAISDLKNLDHIIVSGSAMIFETFDQVRDLLLTIPGEKVLLGPSAQILPQIAFKHGFTFLGSSKIEDTASTIRVIMEGGGYQAFKAFTTKYSFHRK